MSNTETKARIGYLRMLAEVFDVELSEARLTAYLDALQDLDASTFAEAVRRAIRGLKWFPKPAELREQVAPDIDGDAELAWGRLLMEVRRVGQYDTPVLDAASDAAVCHCWGSWRRLCETLPAEGPELLGHWKRWLAVYAVQAKRREALPAAPAPRLGDAGWARLGE